ncbi:MAG: TonB-dependent receptor [Chitinophagaceae bacterium]|nr:TonB-dependent receptor [Chitinophagaceae bacterium]MBL0054758.1 TonB-dependent receptor [Chitinophagaceae bacterium]
MNQHNQHTAFKIITALLMIVPAGVSAQRKFNDTATIKEIVVTATRTVKSIGDIPVPVQVISRKFIQQTGSQKLIDILQQQTGLVLADNPLGQALQGYPNPFGSGVQLQGLDPAYTLILLDGEPLTGRNAGILNLGRVAVGQIKQIEIVKGPATSLYGSDALAGVINIITEKAVSNNGSIQLHHSSNNTWGFSASGTLKKNLTALQVFANRMSSSGYDLDENIYGKTVDPYHNYSLAAKLNIDLSPNTQFQTSARLFTQKQFNNYLVYTGTQPQTVEGSSNETDWSVSNQLHHRFSNRIKLITRFYTTGYRDHADVFLQKDGSLFDRSNMQQFLLKPEIQLEFGAKQNQLLIAGAGYNYETIEASRYASAKKFNAFYFYTQKEWLPLQNLNITLGARLDKHSLYKMQFNPKLAMAYRPGQKLTLLGSVGTGFKAPDFRQQFLSFSNSLVGYTLLGANELNNGLITLKQQGQIDPNTDITPYLTDHRLLPERSVGINLGFRYLPDNKTTINAGFFRNDISNLIDRYNLPITKINNQAIYSYVNVNRVFTQGAELSVSRKLGKSWQINSGYQYLDAKDKDVVNRLKENKIVKRDPVTYQSDYVKRSEYGGLFNRSKHSANLQVAWTETKQRFNGSLRAVYRGRFGYSDINGDNILDDDREYAEGYLLLNASFGINLPRGISLQAGSDNILNHMDRVKLPNLSGRSYFINCSIDLIKISTKK